MIWVLTPNPGLIARVAREAQRKHFTPPFHGDGRARKYGRLAGAGIGKRQSA